MQHRQIVAAAREAGVKLIRFEYCDVSGVARAKAIQIGQLEHKLLEGVSLTRAQMAINLLEQLVHVDGMEPVGEPRLVPDRSAFSVLPWAPGSASVLCDQWGGTPPRSRDVGMPSCGRRRWSYGRLRADDACRASPVVVQWSHGCAALGTAARTPSPHRGVAA